MEKEDTAMSNQTTEPTVQSRPDWDDLESWARAKVQHFIQDILEEEVADFLGRGKSERRDLVDGKAGYRNGHGRERKLTLSSGTVKLRRPRVRDSEERFESRVLALFARRSKELSELIPELYLHGLAEGDFELALGGLLGDEAPISASTVSRLKEKWNAELTEWNQRPVDQLEVVYLWVDGVYVKAGLEKDKAALLVAIAALSDGTKMVLSVTPGYRESTESWSEVLRDLKARGMNMPRVVIGDGHLGIWGAMRNVCPESKEQRCWNHKIMNVLSKIPKREHEQARRLLCAIPYADTRAECERLKAELFRGALSAAIRPSPTPWTETGTGWSPSTSFPKNTGIIFGPPILWSLPSPL